MTNQPIPVVTESGDYSFYAENLDQCIKGTYQFTGTLYQNICDGSVNFVANGFWDYALGITLLSFAVVILLMLLTSILE